MHSIKEGAVPAKIIFDKDIPFENIYNRNLVDEVSIKEPRVFGKGDLKVRFTLLTRFTTAFRLITLCSSYRNSLLRWIAA